MKNISKTLATLSALVLFVILNWATSEEELYIALNAEVSIYQDSLLILNNLDSLTITDAELFLIHDQPVGMEGNYRIFGYNLSSLSSDTMAVADFINFDNQAYPDTIPPTRFSLTFDLPTRDGFSGYSTEFE
ncbi:MAG: hypothetical protein ACI94Y_003212 [Maribacter sp.]|jgi:hypothetical protein